MSPTSDLASPLDDFPRRHLGDDADATTAMLRVVGPWSDAAALADAAVPAAIRRPALELPTPLGESEALAELRRIAADNQTVRSFIGMGYHDTVTPPVIQRNILENPAWYTAYTPYQAEIAQGRLEALLHFQTLVCELTGLEISNASLLDEGTAAAEAMLMCRRAAAGAGAAQGASFFVSDACHPQTIDLVRTRARPLGIAVTVGDAGSFEPTTGCCGILVQYPDTWGRIHDFGPLFEKAHAVGALCVTACDPLALVLLRPPGAFGADVAVGSAQRYGTPMGFGGPHAGFLATRDALKRQMPGRLVGVSKDAAGAPALRLSLGTREQHIRRDKATSNICTAQVLPAVLASMYALYHGPVGLRRIAGRVHALTAVLATALRRAGVDIGREPFFDTLVARGVDAASIHEAAGRDGINLRRIDADRVGVSLDETTTLAETVRLAFLLGVPAQTSLEAQAEATAAGQVPAAGKEAGSDRGAGHFGAPHDRRGAALTAAVFSANRTEHEMLRTIKRLEAKDLSLCQSMIALGSCTMKLNATSQMIPLSWPEFARPHPFAPAYQNKGYAKVAADLVQWLAAITGLPAVSLQPNAGSQGEYAGMLAIRGWQESRGQGARRVCLIPASAHGTNPATAALCGLTVVPVACDARGNVDIADLRRQVTAHAEDLAALMITYPSTHGVFEADIREICTLVHAHGGQVYMDGANMNAQVGLTSPGHIGADVCHLNLHKTFCIPHGGGGPGAGPIAVAAHLAPFLPGHAVSPQLIRQGTSAAAGDDGRGDVRGGGRGDGPGPAGAVSSAPLGSASILVIPWMYIRMMGARGLTEATRIAILNANYIARRLDAFFPVLYRGDSGLVAHECIIDLRGWKAHGIEAEDVAKRLMDYGFHAPTLSFPVPGTFMIEPTESETKEEIDRFCEALISIHREILDVVEGRASRTDNLLKGAPHTALAVCAEAWTHPYTREQAAFPAPWTRLSKFWPAVGRIDNVWGDRNLVCSCAGMDAVIAAAAPQAAG